MRAKVQPDVELFLKNVAHAPRSLLLLDYDGTLAPFRTERDQAFPYPSVVPVLQDIVRNGRTRVVIISGREAGEILPLLSIEPKLEVWGLHGAQRMMPDGAAEDPHLDQDSVAALSAADSWLSYQQLRHMAEFKTGSIAIHWRGLGESEADSIRGRVLLGWVHIAQDAGLDLLEFDGGVEIRAATSDKGDAVRSLLSEMSANTPAAYLGDDSTDERAFRAINGRGLSVLARPQWRQTAAQLWLKPPEELLDFLTRWLKACQAHDASSSEAAAAVKE